MNKSASKIYRITNWSPYMSSILRRFKLIVAISLFGLIPITQRYAQSIHKQGRNQTYSDKAIQYCLIIKSLFRLTLRITTGFVQSLVRLCRLDWTAPNYSTLFGRQKYTDIAISLEQSRDGLHL